MATVCTACGTENREKARYCRGCARPLGPLGTPDASADPAADAASPHHHTSRSPGGARRAARQRRTAIRWGLGAAVLVAVLVGWQLWPREAAVEPASIAAAPADPVAPVMVAATVPPVVLAAASTSPTPATALTDAMTPQPAAPAKPVAAPTRVKPAPVRSKEAMPATTPAPVPARSEPAAPATVAEAAPAPVPAPRPRGVDEACADRGNFLSRDLCRIQACRNPALAGDPVCVRFREMEEANRRRGDN